MKPHFSLLDKVCLQIDAALKTLAPAPHQTVKRPHGAENIPEADLSPSEKKQTAAFMRINHVGEVCAQGLYQGQALTARLDSVRDQMQQASAEEQDHLIWCAERIAQLGGRVSYLNPLFYSGAFSLGAIAGAIGDKWSLGFVAETEAQVSAHLQNHLDRLAPTDHKTRKILETMQSEEAHHAETALNAGGKPLPAPIKTVMKFFAKCMTTSAYYV